MIGVVSLNAVLRVAVDILADVLGVWGWLGSCRGPENLLIALGGGEITSESEVIEVVSGCPSAIEADIGAWVRHEVGWLDGLKLNISRLEKLMMWIGARGAKDPHFPMELDKYIVRRAPTLQFNHFQFMMWKIS